MNASPTMPEYGGLEEDGNRIMGDGSNFTSFPPIVAQTAGVLVALPGSGRFLSTAPYDFYDGNLFDRSPWKKNVRRIIDEVRANSHTNATTLRKDLERLGIPKEKEFEYCHHKNELEYFCKEVNRRREKDRLVSIAFHCVTILPTHMPRTWCRHSTAHLELNLLFWSHSQKNLV